MNAAERKSAVRSETGTDLSAAAMSYEALKRFRLIFRAVQQHSQRVEQSCGVSSAQLWVLSELADDPGQRVSDLAKVMSIHPSTASNLLDKLEQKGLVRKERQNQDQRVVRLTLTESGLDALEKAPQPTKGILQTALFTLPIDVLGSLVDDLGALVAAMQIQDDQAALRPLDPLNVAIASDRQLRPADALTTKIIA